MKLLVEPRSGSYQGITSSRNRFGQYVRNRSTPVQPRTVAQLGVRTRLSLNAAAWRGLTSAQRDGWTSLGLSISRTDSLGQTYNLTGFAAYCLVNNNLDFAGSAKISDAPAYSVPAGILTATPTLTGGGSPVFSIAYTTTPLATGVKLIVRASPQRSAGRTFEADYRFIFLSAAAAASPANVLSGYAAKFGNPVTGNRVFMSLQTTLGGFVSAPFPLSAVAS